MPAETKKDHTMKNIILTFSVASVLATGGAHAQNVGIGEPNPNAKLDIRGNGTSSSSSSLNVSDANSNAILTVRDDQKVGIGNSTPDASAVLDIQASNAGILIPRLTDNQMNAVANPAAGLLVYNSDQNKFFFFNGSQWIPLGTGGNNNASDPTLIYTTDGF